MPTSRFKQESLGKESFIYYMEHCYDSLGRNIKDGVQDGCQLGF